MKFECDKNLLRNKLQLLERVTGKNLSLLILNNILLEVKDSFLILKATNLEVGVEIKIPIKQGKNGVVAIDGKIINSFLSSLEGEETIKVEKIGNNLSFITKNNSTLINTNPTEEFPNIPKILKNKTQINSSVIVDGIKSVWFSVSFSDIKPEISSVLVYEKDENLVFVATDSFRLSEKKIKCGGTTLGSILIPQKSALEIIRFFEDVDGEINIFSDKNQLSLESNDTYLTTRLTDGVYPDYKQIIPTNSKTKTVVLTKDLIQALKTSNIFVDEFNKINIKIIPEDSILELESKNQKTGENISQIKSHITGEAIETSFNYKYINEVFQTINTDSVSLELTDRNKPLLITGVGDTSFLYIVMPVNR